MKSLLVVFALFAMLAFFCSAACAAPGPCDAAHGICTVQVTAVVAARPVAQTIRAVAAVPVHAFERTCEALAERRPILQRKPVRTFLKRTIGR